MASPHRFRAPAGNGEVLAVPGFDAVAQSVEENRRQLDRDDVTIGGMPLRELRRLARREVLELVKSPPGGTGGLFLAGHQPELSHPGVWVKNFALNGLAHKLGGTPLHLIVDNDTLKHPSLRIPTFRDGDPKSVHSQSVPFDRLDGEMPYEARPVHDEGLFATFAERAAPLWQNWGYEPLLAKCWASGGREPPDSERRSEDSESLTEPRGLRPPLAQHSPLTIGERFSAMRRNRERDWGCDNLELPVSRLAGTEAFARFAAHILAELPRFRAAYNAAIRAYRAANGIRSENHPAPELAVDEAPFWEVSPPIAMGGLGGATRRTRASAASDVRHLRPRALTLTLFARVCLGDYFLHGIGGGKYDEVTDAIIRDYFGLEPPAYQVLSATLHLPLPGFAATDDDVKRAERFVRDLKWNPDRYASEADRDNPRWLRLIADRANLTANGPFAPTREGRRDWFDELRFVVERLRPFAEVGLRDAEAALQRTRIEAHANAVLRRRDYAWVLYPEDVLKPFLQRFLNVY